MPPLFRIPLLSGILLILVKPACGLDMQAVSRPFLPALEGADLLSLRDAVYYFPANYLPGKKPVYLPLCRWDLIFTGDYSNAYGSEIDVENLNYLIPGPFNHMAVYMGKDSRGMAYMVELRPWSLTDLGGAVLACIGSDYGLVRHPGRSDLHDRRILDRRWALRLNAETRARLEAAEEVLLARIQSDLVMGFPYELEFRHSGSVFDPNVYIVDDGLEGGATCADYWTAVFEEYAGVCLKNVRMNAEELEAYFRTDPEGMLAYAPAEMSPFPQPLRMSYILDLGFRAVDDDPHVYSCDGTRETGIVLPSLIMENELLEPIEPVGWPVKLPHIILKP